MSRLKIMTTSENVTQKSITRPRLSVHHFSFLYALCHEFVRSTIQRDLRARLVGDPILGAPEHQHLDQLPEDYPVGDTGTVTTERMLHP